MTAATVQELPRRALTDRLARHGFLLVLALLFVGLSLATRAFFTLDNQMGMLHAMAPVVIIAAGMALVVMSVLSGISAICQLARSISM